jgi:hypothetical protein
MGDPLLRRSETLVPSKIVLICSTVSYAVAAAKS